WADLVLSVLRRIGVPTWRDGVLAPDPPVDGMRAELSTTLVPQHVSGRLLCLALGPVEARCAFGIVALIDPGAVLAFVHRPVSLLAHSVPVGRGVHSWVDCPRASDRENRYAVLTYSVNGTAA